MYCYHESMNNMNLNYKEYKIKVFLDRILPFLKEKAIKNFYPTDFNCIKKSDLIESVEELKQEINDNLKFETEINIGFEYFLKDPSYKSSYGVYSFIPNLAKSEQKIFKKTLTNKINKEKKNKVNISSFIPNLAIQNNTNETENACFVPKKDPSYIKPSIFNSIKKIIQSQMFFPIYIYGESGAGKTTLVEQVCAETNRELFVISITEQTTEEDLIGSMRLENGNTVYRYGPIVQAMKRGAVVLLDEFDLATTKIMCLQRIMEGKPILIKKETEIVYPAPGFNIIAAANTNGKILDSGRYIGARVQNEAILDRFSAIYKLEYLSEEQEKDMILRKINNEFKTIFQSMGNEEKERTYDEINKFVFYLVNWANNIRKTFEVGGIEETISSRRLIFIVKYWLLTGCKQKDAISFCISRFSPEIQESMLKLYEPISGE